jgi:hypothetical protein
MGFCSNALVDPYGCFKLNSCHTCKKKEANECQAKMINGNFIKTHKVNGDGVELPQMVGSLVQQQKDIPTRQIAKAMPSEMVGEDNSFNLAIIE